MKISMRQLGILIPVSFVTASAFARDTIALGENYGRWVVGGAATVSNNIYAVEDDFSSIGPTIASACVVVSPAYRG